MTGISEAASISRTSSSEALFDPQVEERDSSSFSRNIVRLCGCVPGAFQALVSGFRNSRSREVAVPTKIHCDYQESYGGIEELQGKIKNLNKTICSKLESCSDIETLESWLSEVNRYETVVQEMGYELEKQNVYNEKLDTLISLSGRLSALGEDIEEKIKGLNENPPRSDEVPPSNHEANDRVGKPGWQELDVSTGKVIAEWPNKL
ncbi:hypothetical protein [Microbulbifer sp. JTAC008]|uniref:hypothetical protein n=1 Tax=unclassified Microbulbifer TaxID=2619833 RepID=UPI004039C02F